MLPFAKKARRLVLPSEDARLLLRNANRPLALSSLSAAAVAAARTLPLGQSFLTIPVRPSAAGAALPPVVLPVRRLSAKDALRLQLLHTAGLEHRTAAIAEGVIAMLPPAQGEE